MSLDIDPEKALNESDVAAVTQESPTSARSELDATPHGTWSQRFIDSFKRNPIASIAATQAEEQQKATRGVYNHKAAAEATAQSPLARKLKGRHMQMIAIGGNIGTGLFITSGRALSTGGPASLVIDFIIIGVLMFCTIQALGELAVAFPVAGAFSAYSTRFLDPAWGFAMGWNYAIQLLVVLPTEIVAASITLSFWPGAESTNAAAFVVIFLFAMVIINLFGVRGYGEAEFIFSIIKITAVLGFVILGIALDCGAGPKGAYIGGRYWYTNRVSPDYAGYHTAPMQAQGSITSGAFNAGFKGVCSVLVTAAFTFGGTELIGLTAAEAENPRKALPTAIKQVFWRICFFYIVSIIIVSLLVPYGDSRLLGSSSEDAKASPFVIAIKNANINVLPSIMNAVILISIISVGNASIYGSSRTLAALAEQGQAPHFLAYIDQQGRPLFAIIIATIFGCLCFLVGGGSITAGTALEWLYSLAGLSSIFTWGSICLAHIRFRAAWKHQGHSLHELRFCSQAGIIGSWIGLTLNVLIFLAQFWTAAWPIGYSAMISDARAQNFFLNMLGAPVISVFYLGYKVYFRTPFMNINSIDVVTGRRTADTNATMETDRTERIQWPRWKRIYKIFC